MPALWHSAYVITATVYGRQHSTATAELFRDKAGNKFKSSGQTKYRKS